MATFVKNCYQSAAKLFVIVVDKSFEGKNDTRRPPWHGNILNYSITTSGHIDSYSAGNNSKIAAFANDMTAGKVISLKDIGTV